MVQLSKPSFRRKEKDMFIKLHTVLFEKTDLKHSEIILLSYLLDCGYKYVRMSNEKLGSVLGLSPRTISRAVNNLAKKEYISVTYFDLKEGKSLKYRIIKPLVAIQASGNAFDNYFMYNPIWKKEMGMTIGEAIVLAFFNSYCRFKKSREVTGFSVKDLCDTLRLSYGKVSNALKNLEIMGCLTHRKVEGSKYNVYSLSIPFAKAENEEMLQDAYLNFPELSSKINDVLALRETWLYIRCSARRFFWEMLDKERHRRSYSCLGELI